MFYIGKTYANGKGEKFEVLMHNWKGRFPIITKNVKTKKLVNYTHEGQFHQKKTDNNLDLIESEIA